MKSNLRVGVEELLDSLCFVGERLSSTMWIFLAHLVLLTVRSHILDAVWELFDNTVRLPIREAEKKAKLADFPFCPPMTIDGIHLFALLTVLYQLSFWRRLSK